jgi:hypothetical protein
LFPELLAVTRKVNTDDDAIILQNIKTDFTTSIVHSYLYEEGFKTFNLKRRRHNKIMTRQTTTNWRRATSTVGTETGWFQRPFPVYTH